LGFTLPGPAAATHAKPSRWRSTSLRGRTRAATVNVLVSKPPFAVLACVSRRV